MFTYVEIYNFLIVIISLQVRRHSYEVSSKRSKSEIYTTIIETSFLNELFRGSLETQVQVVIIHRVRESVFNVKCTCA